MFLVDLLMSGAGVGAGVGESTSGNSGTLTSSRVKSSQRILWSLSDVAWLRSVSWCGPYDA